MSVGERLIAGLSGVPAAAAWSRRLGLIFSAKWMALIHNVVRRWRQKGF